jgi:prepilin-type N-terminal cleavage/methylation domain-containing protein
MLTRDNAGMTLLEITIAMALFAVVIGVTATSLASFYVNMDVQEQRIEAMHSCRAVLDALREKRAEFVDIGLENASEFPMGLVEWIEDQNTEGWTAFLRGYNFDPETGAPVGPAQLSDHAITVQVSNADGGSVTADSNPIQVHVVSSWNDRQGRPLQVELVSLLADR